MRWKPVTPPSDWITPEWDAPAGVRSLITTRAGGLSRGPYASLNLGMRVNDDPAIVARNRDLLRAVLPAAPVWLHQVHGTRVVDAASCTPGIEVEADAAFTRQAGVVCTVQMADCMPVLLCDDKATVVGVAHAGWRGLAGGIIERTLEAMMTDPQRMLAYLGPAIGPDAFEVGDDVRDAFTAMHPQAVEAFAPRATGKWLCNLFTLALQRLQAAGVGRVFTANDCTVSQPGRFFSHRRDRVTGRMAAFIWLEHA